MQNNIVELAKDVERAKANWEQARLRLWAALTDEGVRGFKLTPKGLNGQKKSNPGGPSTAARVLSLVEDAGPAGITRADLHAKLPGMEKAIHSALKYQSAQKKIWSDDGRWKAAAHKRSAGGRQATKKAQEAVSG